MKIIGQVGGLVSRRDGWSSSLGDYVEELYKGTAAYANAVYAALRGNCAELEKDLDGGMGMVRARFASVTDPGGGNQLRVEIRRGRNDVQKSIFEPGVDGFTGGVTTTELRYIKALIDDPLDDVAFEWLDDNGSPEAFALYELAQSGLAYRIVRQPTLIQITTADDNFPWPSQEALSGRILTRDSMLGMLRQTPNFVVPANPGVAPDAFAYGWMFLGPTYEAASDGHSQEVLEFEFGLWPTQIFGDVV
jgi:hypothetical protein